MNEEAGFLATIRADPADDTHRLVYADWLEEQGGEHRATHAAFIRLGVKAALLTHRHNYSGGGCERCKMERQLRVMEAWAWDHLVPPQLVGRCVFRRGFVAQVACRAADWLACRSYLEKYHPPVEAAVVDMKWTDYLDTVISAMLDVRRIAFAVHETGWDRSLARDVVTNAGFRGDAEFFELPEQGWLLLNWFGKDMASRRALNQPDFLPR